MRGRPDRQRRSSPASIAAARLASISPSPLAAAISRQRSQPRTAGASGRAIWRTSGFAHSSRKAPDPRPHRLQRALQLGAEDDAGDPLGHLALELVVDGIEQPGLAAEVVVQGAAGDPGGLTICSELTSS